MCFKDLKTLNKGLTFNRYEGEAKLHKTCIEFDLKKIPKTFALR